MYKFLIVIIIFISIHLKAEIKTFPAPDGIKASKQYKVEIIQNNIIRKSFVYISKAQYPKFNKSHSVSFTEFLFTGKILVKVTKLFGTFNKCRILPSSFGITTKKEGNSILFQIDQPRKIAIEFDDKITNPLLIFADAPEKNQYKADNPNVIYFGPGIHNPPGGIIKPKAGQIIYLAGGSIVNALINVENVPNVIITGHGILNGRKFAWERGRPDVFIKIKGKSSKNVLVEDIILLDSPGYNIASNSPNTKIINVKTIGWWFNTDGVSTGQNGLVENCFLKCNDDAIKLYSNDMKVIGTTIWQMENGAPFQFSWGLNNNVSNILVKDCYVIHVDHSWDNPNEAVFDAIHGGKAHLTNYLFENIRIENAPWRLINLHIMRNRYAKSKVLGSISNITFKNISVKTGDDMPLRRINVIEGFNKNSKITNIKFENLEINGRYIQNREEGNFEIEKRTTNNISFIITKKRKITNSKRLFNTINPKIFSWNNPIKNGLNSYGQKDFHLIKDGDKWYYTATEMVNPEWHKKGIILYVSEDLLHWREDTYLINRHSLNKNVWYHDVWATPQIHKIDEKYYLTFNCRNNKSNPYGRLGLGIAVASKIAGPYHILTKEKPLVIGNHGTLFNDKNGKVYVCWELDGRFYGAQINLDNLKFITKPKEVLGPKSLKKKYHFLDSPFIMRKNNTYYLIFSQFFAGYIEKVKYLKSTNSPLGPWKIDNEKTLMSYIESEAPDSLNMPYSVGYTFAPPTQVMFNNQIFKGPGEQYYIAFHSSPKYAEPYLMIVPIKFNTNSEMILKNYKSPHQQVILN